MNALIINENMKNWALLPNFRNCCLCLAMNIVWLTIVLLPYTVHEYQQSSWLHHKVKTMVPHKTFLS